MKGVLKCAIVAVLFSSALLALGLLSGFPSAGGGLFMLAGLPGYGTAATVTSMMYGADDINSKPALVIFGLVYVLVNAAFYNSVFIVAWRGILALGRLSKRRQRI